MDSKPIARDTTDDKQGARHNGQRTRRATASGTAGEREGERERERGRARERERASERAGGRHDGRPTMARDTTMTRDMTDGKARVHFYWIRKGCAT